MKPNLNLPLMLVMTFMPLVTACKADTTAAADSVVAKRVERGRYLVSTSACHDCHTPWKMTERGPEPDMTRMLSGHPSSLKVPRRRRDLLEVAS